MALETTWIVIHDLVSFLSAGTLFAFGALILGQAWHKKLNWVIAIWLILTGIGLLQSLVTAMHVRADLLTAGRAQLTLSTYAVLPSMAYACLMVAMLEYAKPWTVKIRKYVQRCMLSLLGVNILNGLFGIQYEIAGNPIVAFNAVNGYPEPITFTWNSILMAIVTPLAALVVCAIVFLGTAKIHKLVKIGIGINTLWLFLYTVPQGGDFVASLTVFSISLVCVGVFQDTLFYPLVGINDQLEVQQKELEASYAETEKLVQARTAELAIQVQRNEELTAQLDYSLGQEVRLGWMKSSIIKMVADEFETPLETIDAQAPALAATLQDLSLAEREEKTLAIRESIRTITDLLDEVVEVERAQPLLAPSYEAYAADTLLQALNAALATAVARPAVQYSVEKSSAFVANTITVPVDYLSQILATLLNKLSGISAPVEICLHASDNKMLHVSLTSSEIAAPLGKHSQLLELVIRANESRALSGLTLGVYLINRHINALDGDITLTSSADGRQGVLNLYIPLRSPAMA